MASECADERIDTHRLLLLRHPVAERVVVHAYLHQIDSQIAERAEVGLVADEALHARVAGHPVHVGSGRILNEGERRRQRARQALERTFAVAVVVDKRALRFGDEVVLEEVVGARPVVHTKANIVVLHPHRQPVVVAATLAHYLELSAEADAGAARIREIGCLDLLEQVVVVELEATHELAPLVHAALAVGERPLVELRVERAAHGDVGAEQRGDHDRRGQEVERILGGVLYVQVEAALGAVADRVAPVVGQTGVELDAERELGRVDGVDEIFAVGIEAIAAAQDRMPHPREVARVAQSVADAARDEHLLETAQRSLLLVGHQLAGRVERVLLHGEYGSGRVVDGMRCGAKCLRHAVVGREWIDLTDG